MATIVQVEGLDDVAAWIDHRAPLPFVPRFHPVVAAPAPPCAAVDGSSAVLADTGSTWVVAVRAAGLPWPGPVHPPPVRLVATTADAAQTHVDSLYARHGLPPPPVHSAEGFAEAHRSLAEADAATRAVHALPEGGLLLVDGALTSLPPAAQALADRILDRATASGVHVAGISKRSGWCVDGRPLVDAVDEAAAASGVAAPWWCPVPGSTSTVARLHPQASHAFRVDAETAAMGWLAHLARDAAYLGYPYPLAKVHNVVAISHKEARRLRERLDRHLGPGASALRDFHAVLDRNAPR